MLGQCLGQPISKKVIFLLISYSGTTAIYSPYKKQKIFIEVFQYVLKSLKTFFIRNYLIILI